MGVTVSMWEGDKAQALIDAIKSTQKVDKRQGTANAGKALVVGDDGLVGFGNAGISDEAKLALLACFQNVAWNTDRGKILYDDLRDALLGRGSSHVLYELPSETVFNGTNFIDTGVSVFEEDRSYSYTIDFTENANFESVPTDMYVVQCMFEQSPYAGFGVQVVRATYTGNNVRTVASANACRYTQVQRYDTAGSRRIKIGFSHEKGATSIKAAMSIDGVLAVPDSGLTTLDQYDITRTHNQHLFLGAGMQVNGQMFKFFKGTIHSFKLVDYAYTQADLDEFVSQGEV